MHSSVFCSLLCELVLVRFICVYNFTALPWTSCCYFFRLYAVASAKGLALNCVCFNCSLVL